MLRESEEEEHGTLNPIMGNRRTSPVTKIRTYGLMLSSGVRIDLLNCCYSSDMIRNIISFYVFFIQGFRYSFNKDIRYIYAYNNGVLRLKLYLVMVCMKL